MDRAYNSKEALFDELNYLRNTQSIAVTSLEKKQHVVRSMQKQHAKKKEKERLKGNRLKFDNWCLSAYERQHLELYQKYKKEQQELKDQERSIRARDFQMVIDNYWVRRLELEESQWPEKSREKEEQIRILEAEVVRYDQEIEKNVELIERAFRPRTTLDVILKRIKRLFVCGGCKVAPM